MSDSGGESAREGGAPTELMDMDALGTYLRKLVDVLLEGGDGGGQLKAFDAAVKGAEGVDVMRRFISERQCPVLQVARLPLARDEDAELSATESDLDANEPATYSFTTEVSFTSQRATSVLLLKRGAVLEADKKPAAQIRVIELTEGNPYETLRAYMGSAMAPFFKSYVRAGAAAAEGGSYREWDKLAPAVEKKMSELEMSLLHLQQNIEIPEISLVAHPTILAAIKRAKEQRRKASVADFSDKIDDSNFLNALQNSVNRWIKEIHKVTRLERDPSTGTAMQEITFWLNLDRALKQVAEMREAPEVQLTLDVLKAGKRFQATIGFDSDTGLAAANATVADYVQLMKDFPLNDLLSATELIKIEAAVKEIFNHMRKYRHTKYPAQRCVKLLEAISRDIQNQMIKVLSTRRLMHISIQEFDQIYGQCQEIFKAWEDDYDKFQGVLRDQMKKSTRRDAEKTYLFRIQVEHKKLAARLAQMHKYRRQHEQLRTVIARVLRPAASEQQKRAAGTDASEVAAATDGADALAPHQGILQLLGVPHQVVLDLADQNAIEEVNVAYDNVKEVDCLDVSQEGQEAWDAAWRLYEERIDRVESRITVKLRDQLGAARSANEMLQIFSRFNALFVRPHIRGAIHEYQTQLIQRVEQAPLPDPDIRTLQDKFTVHYNQSNACKSSACHDIPPVAGSIIWVKQIERQLDTYMKRVGDVLGHGWENQLEGQKLKSDGENFRQKLNTQHIFDDWVQRMSQKKLDVGTGKLFAVEICRRQGKQQQQLKLSVNFSPDVIQLAKEVRHLKHLRFRLPLNIVNKAIYAQQLYPLAVSLIDSVRIYDAINERIGEKADAALLVAGVKRDIQKMIEQAAGITWDSHRRDPYVAKFSETIGKFQELVEELLAVQEQIDVNLSALDTCQYAFPVLQGVLATIQKCVDALSLDKYSNLGVWVDTLDQKIEAKLTRRLQEAVKAWTKALEGRQNEEDMDSDDTAAQFKIGGDPKITTLPHEIRLTQQVMYLNPPVEEVRAKLLDQLFAWEAIVLSQKRISSTRFDVTLESDGADSCTYKRLLAKLPDGMQAVETAYEAVENIVTQVDNYVKEWLRLQALWDLQPANIYDQLGDDLPMWMKLLVDFKKSRSTFDTSESRKQLGPVVVDYARVQSKVTMKYDTWHSEVLGRFGSALSDNMTSFYSELNKARNELETQSIDAASTGEAVAFITYVQGLKKNMKEWQKCAELYKDGQVLLERQRYQFPTTWLYADQIDGEWSSFADILQRKDNSIQSQVQGLQTKIRSEDKVVEQRTSELLQEWEAGKPVAGAQRPESALDALKLYESKLHKLKDDRDNIVRAKDALELADSAQPSVLSDKLGVALEELSDLKGVWQSLMPLTTQMDELRDKPWLSVQPRKLRQHLDSLLASLKELPAKCRSYDGYEHMKRQVQSCAKVNLLLTELKSEALKERHWKSLMRQLKVNWNLNDLSLGQVWDADLIRHEGVIRDVLLTAQGEMALEEFMKQVRDMWQSYELELVQYQGKTKLIRGWDDLFNKLKEHMNSLAAMKLSPYYKEFEEEALSWEDKLNRINALFDVWIDVQRRWVYLEGIFSGSADIKTLLPVETQRFSSISTEFLTLMKKVSSAPRVMEIVNMQGVQRLLERLADLLSKIQKALGEYLERERASFPRFYFVGDEDLLEIIGNSKNMARLQKHFKKMFAGVAAILLNADDTQVLGLASREGEEITFHSPVSLKEHPRINDWLRCVECEMRGTLARMLAQSVAEFAKLKQQGAGGESTVYNHWLDLFPAQIVVLTAQISWSEEVESVLSAGKSLESTLQSVDGMLALLADAVLQEQPPLRRRKLEHLITEFVHKRDVTRALIDKKINNNRTFDWLRHMRFYFDPNEADVLKKLSIRMANATFHYGFEYLGVQDKLVQTPLTDRCYLTMTQALEARLGGSPFGPAGTGKTETVKALGNQLGRFVLVFNCDETFDFQAMGRIFVGLCQVGAWGCFDEFNRLEERMLSAVSQQIQMIQETLRSLQTTPDADLSVELIGKQVRVNADMAIFITMNPGYAGRSNLPDNLKQLFRSLAMTKPDLKLIAQVMLFSQGFRTAEVLARKIVPFFKLCNEQLSSQTHYDFSLRALKYVLVSAGNIKRDRIARIKEEAIETGGEMSESAIAEQLPEQEILIQSVCETMVPKLVAEDIPLLFSLLSDVFPGVPYTPAQMKRLRAELGRVCEERFLCYSHESGELGAAFVDKALQLYQITNLNHGLMMVGPSGSGKTSAWQVLLTALQRLEGVEGVAHVIDPKAISKECLYGTLDPNTREWTDGLFTHVLRKIVDNVRGELDKRQWIVFDGDVDPEWVENLNSVLDDNKLLTLPNGERLALPPNVRLMFEVQDLRFATPATVSRCGMVWFSDDIVSTEMLADQYLQRLRRLSLDEMELAAMGGAGAKGLGVGGATAATGATVEAAKEDALSVNLQVQRDVAQILAPQLGSDGMVNRCLAYAETDLEHVMDFTRLRALSSLFAMINYNVRQIQLYNSHHQDFPMASDQMERYILRSLVSNVVWAFSGDGRMSQRQKMSDYIRRVTTVPLPPVDSVPIVDYEVTVSGEWSAWTTKVPQVEIETHRVAATDLVIPTVDTVRHEHLLQTWLAEHKPMCLCGPPGSGKTMTLFAALRSMPDMEVVGLNFSSATTPELVMKTLDHYCEYKRTPNGVVLAPAALGRWLVLFCDEINLPNVDEYGTQRVISFLRQIVEQNGFYRASDHAWVKMERIQLVGACNPPTDPGRKPLSHRFLRHVPVVYVDYPAEVSLKQIYGTFNRAMLRLVPSLRAFGDPLTGAMVEFYLDSQDKFTQEQQPHYVYSPRELTRWVRGIYEAIRPLDSLPVEGLVRLWAHEAQRLFHDRLITNEERKWTEEHIDSVALKHFPSVDAKTALVRPILYSCWLTKDYMPVQRNELRDFVKARLKVFYEEELDVPLVLFDEVLDHVLRIDRIFRQPQGHLLLIGVSGSGKTTLSRFVAWMNGLSVVQLKVHGKYTAADFDEDLRTVLRRAGCRDEKIAFIMDESNVLDTSFLERLNTLLANGEVPGLFEGDEHTTLMTQIKEGAVRDGHMLDTSEELYKWFTQQVIKNVHIVFTMNPSSAGLRDRAATSPALFNRCVLNWFGDWPDSALYQVGKEFTITVDLDRPKFEPPIGFPFACDVVPRPPSYRDAVINSMVYVHQTLHAVNKRLSRRGQRTMAITPRHFLDFISHFTNLFKEKRDELEDQQLHLNVGLNKIKETAEQVKELQKSLSEKSRELETKNAAANAKLKQMVSDQQKAEKEKQLGEKMEEELTKQSAMIDEKAATVQKDLDEVEPAVEDARQAVKGIRRQQLVELRSMAQPPAPVKLTLEAVCLLLGDACSDWKSIRQVMVKDDFMQRVIAFDTDSITPEIRDMMTKKYLSTADFEFEKVNRASTACGPLVKWARAQMKYSDMLTKVDPLRYELNRLRKSADDTKTKVDGLKKEIASLETSIAAYKVEYAQLISQAEAIKHDLATVQEKVDRSIQLLRSLGDESTRWEASAVKFKSQMDTLVGDCLLTAAFLAYAGYFDQQLRATLFHTWQAHADGCGVQARPDLARVEFLCSPDDRLQWHGHSLPADDLCIENAIMLTRFNRYPLIIDPSGQASEFLLKEMAEKKITKTSFLDDAFRKNLESALRFGNPLLVQDVESYDPIVNPVLNRELKRTGGRVLITIGDQDIDLSPAFKIFLSTRDPTVEFAPDVCSRVTFVNFTVTRASLQGQCLNRVLKAERPDVDKKRSDLLKLQGEFALRLRHLEKSLLGALNDAKGRILDDNSVIGTLETLKKEAADVAKKAAETDVVMAEVEATSAVYAPLAAACSAIYFTMEQLNQVHFLYQYSLHFFLDIFAAALLDNPRLSEISDHSQRLSVITADLFQLAYTRVARGMLHEDKVTYAILLARIYLRGLANEPNYEAEFEQLLRGAGAELVKQTANQHTARMLASLPGLTQNQANAMQNLATSLPAFANVAQLAADLGDQFIKWMNSDNPEKSVPQLWSEKAPLSPIGRCVCRMLAVHALRPDRFLASAHSFVGAVFGPEFMSEKLLDLKSILECEVKASVPVLMCSVPGYDASGTVHDLAAELNKPVTAIAIGSAEGFSQADAAVSAASKSGRWVLLKNVHLAPQWLAALEKKLHALQPNPTFRLFLTMEIHPKLPVNLLRAGRVLVYEPPPGVKANLLRTFGTLPAPRMAKPPAERARLYFVLAWLHALLQERLRYTPLGWSKVYEFGEADLRMACDTLDNCVDAAAMGRSNLPPEKVPWDALRTLLSQCIYGGKIDNQFDQVLLDCFIDSLFDASSYDPDRVLIADVDGAGTPLKVPDAVRREQFVQWADGIKHLQSPNWLGLPNNAEKVLLTERGSTTIAKLLKMTGDEEEELAGVSADSGAGGMDARPAWMTQLHEAAAQWLLLMPQKIDAMKRTMENIKDPLYRYFEREVNMAGSLLKCVRDDLDDVTAICEGRKKQTNYHRLLTTALTKGLVPDKWRRYDVPAGVTVMHWVADFAERAKQMQAIVDTVKKDQNKALKHVHVWLGGLFSPEAYVTATRQYVAQANAWSLEELKLEVNCAAEFDKLQMDDCSFGVVGMRLMGAQCVDGRQLSLSDKIYTNMAAVQLRWVRATESDTRGSTEVQLPVYLYGDRKRLLFTLDFACADKVTPAVLYQRGVAMVCAQFA